MQDRIAINDHMTVGTQPTEAQLAELKQQGFKTIVNLRQPDEPEQPLAPDAEGEKVRELGMHYVHIPVSEKAMKPEQVDEFRKHLAALPAPVYVHCRKGKRAGAFAMMHASVEAGASGDQTLQQAEQMGFECDVPEIKEFVKRYIDSHRK
jgi:uncharacterized protein (TIGR01244 family)